MRTFEHPDFSGGFTCPICSTSADAPVVLVLIAGTEDGNIMEAAQVHAECYELYIKMKGKEEQK